MVGDGKKSLLRGIRKSLMYHDLRGFFFTKGSLPGVSGRRLLAVTNFSSKLYIDPHKHAFYIGYCKQEKQERKHKNKK